MEKHKLDVPPVLTQIPSPPKDLYFYGGNLDEILDKKPRIAVVGSRKMSSYGKAITERLVTDLVHRGFVIISGLALGIDGQAHRAALEAKGITIAVLACGLDEIYPRSHRQLAIQMIRTGGGLLSEYPEGTAPYPSNFLARNRLIAGLSQAVLIPEAAERSGSLNTAAHALEQGKPVFAVPGNITSPLSGGTNKLLKSGALLVTEVGDMLSALGLSEQTAQKQLITADNPEEHAVLQLLQQGVSDGHELLLASKLKTAVFNQTLTMLEITGRIKPLGNNHWAMQ